MEAVKEATNSFYPAVKRTKAPWITEEVTSIERRSALDLGNVAQCPSVCSQIQHQRMGTYRTKRAHETCHGRRHELIVPRANRATQTAFANNKGALRTVAPLCKAIQGHQKISGKHQTRCSGQQTKRSSPHGDMGNLGRVWKAVNIFTRPK